MVESADLSSLHYGLAFSENLLGIALFTAPIQWVTGNPVVVHNLAHLASYVLAGGGMYLLALSLTGSRPEAGPHILTVRVMDDASRPALRHSHLQRLDDQRRAQVRGHRPSPRPAG